MDKFNRILQLHQTFSNQRIPKKLDNLAEQLECSTKTVSRTIKQMQLEFNAPLEYVPEYHGWRYSPDKQGNFELPGLWMDESELVSLIMLLSILETFGNGFLNQEMQRINTYISTLLKNRGIDRETIRTRLKVLPITQKILPSKTLYTISEGLIKGYQLNICYTDFKQHKTERIISPQTLVYYRDNWYIDAWCHLRNQLRTFTIARISKVSIKETKAEMLDPAGLTEHFSESYGIFSGKASNIAKLRFLSPIAKEISMQNWHDKQQGHWEGDHYLLKIPFHKSEELIMDIMRYLPHAEVIEPESLKQAIKAKIQQAQKYYCD